MISSFVIPYMTLKFHGRCISDSIGCIDMGRTFRKRNNRKQLSLFIENGKKKRKGKVIVRSLMQWALRCDACIKGITTKNFVKTGKGIKTTRNISPGTIVISLPRKLLITFDDVWNTFANKKCTMNSKLSGLTAKDLFILMLVSEQQNIEKSKYKFYLDSIPKSYTTVSNIERKEFYLLPYFVLEETQNQIKKIKIHFDRLQKQCCDDKIKFDNVKWAWNVLNTRSVYFSPTLLKYKNEVNILDVDFALAPVLDMLNHSSEAEVEAGFNTVRDCYEIKTFTSYKRGEQVFINYGAHSNRTLLNEYGFILPNNIHAHVPIPQEIFLKYFTSRIGDVDTSIVKRQLKDIANVSLDKICCTPNGLDWSFVTAAHAICLQTFSLFNRGKCQGPICVIVEKSKQVLEHMIGEYVKWIGRLNSNKNSSEALLQVKSLLISEKDILQKTLGKLSLTCMLD